MDSFKPGKRGAIRNSRKTTIQSSFPIPKRNPDGYILLNFETIQIEKGGV
jgi:hypothetical protein